MGTWPGPPSLFTSCLAAELYGLVEVQNKTDIIFDTAVAPDAAYYSMFRCAPTVACISSKSVLLTGLAAGCA